MRHVPDGTLRRLVDEPLAVADGDAHHLAHCDRCRMRFELVANDAAMASALVSRPQPVPDIDLGWSRFQGSPTASSPTERALPRFHARKSWRYVGLPVPSTAVLGACAVLVVAAGAAAVFTTISTPARVAPVQAVSTDFQAIADAAGLEGSGVIGGFPTPSGSLRLPFGLVRWTSAGRAHSVASIAVADAATGMDLSLPATVPAGVGPLQTILVQPQVTATITFSSSAGPTLAGTSLEVTAGPAVLVEYGSSLSSLGIPSFATFAMRRPIASSPIASPIGPTSAQLEAFVLSRPGLPAGLAQEIRLLGDLGTSLPVPMPPGANVTQVDIGGSPGVLVAEGSGAASGVIWEDRAGVVYAALGLLDQEDILNVANQLG